MHASVNNVNNQPVINEFNIPVTVIKLVIFALFLLPFARYTLFVNETIETNTTNSSSTDDQREMNEVQFITNNTVEEEPGDGITTVRKILSQQPACPRSHLFSILKEICDEFLLKKLHCTPEDFLNSDKHKIPKLYVRNGYGRNKQAPQLPAIVNWALGGLLLASLCAALIELYKAKQYPEKKHGKNPLSRKCSLADLTVLKHHRKEIMRRDSLMEVPEESLRARQLGSTPPPLHRRSSFPVGPRLPHLAQVNSNNNRRSSLVRSETIVESRRQSIVFDRSQSMIESRKNSVAGSIFVSEEEAKKHHARLVHRH